MAQLQEQLKHYAEGPLYPLHMPGHKRRLSGAPGLPFGWDVTEVEGVDDLHAAEGILKDAMERTARLHGAARTWYLVNGSTCGILAGLRALAPHGGEILAARNCHKSVYHAIELGELTVHYLMPPTDEVSAVPGSISPEAVEQGLTNFPHTACVVLTSPTYEGVLSDIAGIANVCHRHRVPLFVDEAHGAHLGLFPGWPDSAVRLGADLVVESAHKTLPSLTQTALLHLGRESLADPREVERQLDIFETSSPSYPLMASLDGCTALLTEQGAELFTSWREALLAFDKAVAPLKHLRVLCHGDALPHPGFFTFDPGKLPVLCVGTGWSGTSLAAALRERFAFETEMAAGDLLLAMTSPADQKETLCRFAEALLLLDEETTSLPLPPRILLPAPGPSECTIAEALRRPAVSLPLGKALGRCAAETVFAYPPGIPLVAPGEQITGEFLSAYHALKESGTRLYHSHSGAADFIRVLA